MNDFWKKTNKFIDSSTKKVIESINLPKESNISYQSENTSLEVSEMVINLDIAKPRESAIEISFPFTSIYVENTTDEFVSINLILNTRDDFQKTILLKNGDEISIELGGRKAFIYFDSQVGKSITLKFFTTARVKSGSVIVENITKSSYLVGNGTADNDGLSCIVSSKFSTSGDIYTLMFDGVTPSFRCFNNSSFNTGSFVCAGYGTLINLFRVPAGYSAEYIGCETNFFDGLFLGWEMYLVAVIQGQSFADASQVVMSNLSNGRIRGVDDNNNTIPLASVNYYTPMKMSFRVRENSSKTKIVFNENEIVVPVFHDYNGLNNTTKNLIKMLFRLTKN